MPRRKNSIDPSALPFKTEPKCNVCQCASRNKVDKLIAAQFTYKDIAQELIDNDPDFQGKLLDTVRRNVERHSKAHLDLHSKSVRRMMEKRLTEQGQILDDVEGRLVNTRVYLDLMLAKGTEQAADPNARVRMADVIEAVKMLEDQEKSEYQYKLELLTRQVHAIQRAVKDILPSHQMPQLVALAKEYFENPEREESALQQLERATTNE